MKKVAQKILLAICGPLLVFGLLEGGLYLGGKFEPVPVLKQVENKGSDYWASEPNYGPHALLREDAPMPHHVWLPVDRDHDKLRVVMLGESAVAGFPSEEYSLGRVTRALWNESHPTRPMEVANVAMVGASSHILRVFAREAMRLRPDVTVIYAGHNEVIGPYGPGSGFTGSLPSTKLVQLSLAVRNTRTGRALRWMMESAANALRPEASPGWRGLDEHAGNRISHDDPVLDRMVEQTRENLRAMVETALRSGSKVLLCVPAVNLEDWPPMDGEADNPASSATKAYRMARELEASGKMKEAWPLYRQACDLDRMRLRSDTRVREAVRAVAAEFDSPDVGVIDADLWLHEWNPDFATDRQFFLEHVHLTFEGRVAVAQLIVDGIAALTGQSPAPGEGRPEESAARAWWDLHPQRVASVRERLLFTEFDESYLWDATARLLDLKVFAGMEDLPERKQAAAETATSLHRAGLARWNPSAVEEAADRATALEPSDGWVDLKAAEIMANLGQHTPARPHIAAAREKFPRLAQAHMALAQEALRDGQPATALRHLDDMAEFLPEGARPAAIYAAAHRAAGDTAGALPYLEKMARVDPRKPEVWIEWSDVLAETGRSREAVETARRGMTATDDHASVGSQLANLLLEQSHPSPAERLEALELARLAVQTEPQSDRYAETLAVALMANGLESEANAEAGRIVARAAAAGNYDLVTSVNQRLHKARVGAGRRSIFAAENP